jgi:aspartate racemase
MPKHIGIVAISSEGAALCYRTICLEGSKLMGTHGHPEITMHTFPFQDYMRFAKADQWQELGNLMLESAQKLSKTGAEFIICPDNTVHQSLDLVIQLSPLPWLHIAEVVAEEALSRGLSRLVVFGTRWLMEGPVYPVKLSARNIQCEIPEADVRSEIDRLIWTELVNGHIEKNSRQYFQEIILSHKQRGCDGVVLGCTEIPLLITEEESALPALDSTRLLARAALAYALE